MKQKDFFKQLKTELHNHPYRDRYLEELKAHAEDLEKDKSQSSQKLTDNFMKKRMGEPKAVKEIFLKIMNPFEKLFFVLEGLFYGGVFLPIAIILCISIRNILFLEDSSSLGYFLILSILALTTLFIIYRLAFHRFFELSENSLKKRVLWLALIFIPGLFIFCFLSFKQQNYLASQTSNTVLLISVFLGLNLLSGYLAWKYSGKSKKIKAPTGKGNQLTLKRFVLGYFFLSIIVRTILINSISLSGTINNPFLESIAPSLVVMLLIIPLEFIPAFFWSALVGSQYDQTSLLLTFYLHIGLILFLGLQSLYVVIQQRNWFSFRGLIFFYALSLFFIQGDSFINEPEFKVPAINVSELIEKDRVGIFYPTLKYFNSDEGSLFKYQVGADMENEHGFVIEGNAGQFYPLDLSKLEQNFEKPSFDSLIGGMSETYIHGENETIEKFTSPNEIFWDQFITGRGVPISDSIVSPDGKWGLIVLPNGAYDPEEVYLLQLKSINDK